MSKTTLVFYAGLVLKEFPNYWEFNEWRRTACSSNADEYYNGSYVYQPGPKNERAWYRMDGTPVLLSDVPKELRAWQLVMS